MRIFIDANILFSSSLKNSTTRILYDAVIEYSDECITNPHAFEEAKRNLESKMPQQVSEFTAITQQLTISNLFSFCPDVVLPSQDVPILAGAVGAQCTHLWTGDKKHFGQFYGKTFHGVDIVSSVMLADILINRGWRPKV